MSKPKVLLIQPPIYDFALYDLFFKPYGLLRIGKSFYDSGYETAVLNCLDWQDEHTLSVLGPVKRKARGTGKFFRQPVKLPPGIPPIPRQYSRYGILKEAIIETVTAQKPDIVCITTGMTYWYQGVIEVVEVVRRYAPRAKIIIGGIYASLMPEHAERNVGADGVVSGEGLEDLTQLLDRWGFPPLKGDIPEFPMLSPEVWGGSAGVVRLNTGCPLNCEYCASDVLHAAFTPGNPEASFAFIKELYERFNTLQIGFYDDALLVNKTDVLLPFLERTLASGLPWEFYTPNAVHIRYIDREAAELMHRSGFREVRLGFESSIDQFHREYDHKFQFQDFSRAVKDLTDAGFHRSQLPVYVLAGLPGQTREEVETSIHTAADEGVSVSIAEFSPVPGTP
ncbi:MAG: B12-binding domain-containing radical SAM protein, partial [Spirochaetota bacterium]